MRSELAFLAMKEELTRLAPELERDDHLRSIRLVVKFRRRPDAPPRVVECERYSERNVEQARGSPAPGRVAAALRAVRDAITAHRAEVDNDAMLQWLSMLVKYAPDGLARVVEFERSSEMALDRLTRANGATYANPRTE